MVRPPRLRSVQAPQVDELMKEIAGIIRDADLNSEGCGSVAERIHAIYLKHGYGQRDAAELPSIYKKHHVIMGNVKSYYGFYSAIECYELAQQDMIAAGWHKDTKAQDK